MPNLQSWIEEQLKKGYSKKQLKIVLSKKNYPQHVISEVDKIGNANLPKKSPARLFIFIIVILVIVVVVIALPFLPKQKTTTGEITIQEPVSLDELSVTEVSPNDLCNEFKETEYIVSCEEATAKVLADTPGSIEKISIGTIRFPREFDKGPIFLVEEAWIFDIKLENPFFDDLGKEIKFLRVSIGLNDDIGIHRRYLE